MKILIKKSKKWMIERYHFVIVAANSEVVATSEKYHNLTDCMHTAALFHLPINEL